MMKSGRLLALVAAWLVVASDVNARLNKCCAKNQHLLFDDLAGHYRCQDSLEGRKDSLEGTQDSPKGIQDPVVMIHEGHSGSQDPSAEAQEARDGIQAVLDFESFLVAVGNATVNGSQLVEMQSVLENSIPLCPEVSKDHVFLPDFVLVPPTQAHGDYALRFPAGSQVLLEMNGAFRKDFPPDTFCIDRDYEGDLLAIVCPCALVPCVRKCCHHHQAMDEMQECVASEDGPPWRPQARDPAKKELYLLGGKTPDCASVMVISTFDADALVLHDDGSLGGVETEGTSITFPRDTFCADADATTQAHLVLHCVEVDHVSEGVTIFKGVVTLLGALALLVTVSLTAAIPEMRANIHGKMALGHNVSLLVACVFIGIMQLAGNKMVENTCKGFSFVIQYSLLAAFFWLNVMCVEVSWVFSAVRPIKKVGPGFVDTKFVWYSVYAWGTASFISLVTLLVEFIPGAQFKPQFGVSNCFFNNSSKIPQLLFLYGPMAVLLLINLALFIFTASKIMQHRRQTSILSHKDSNTNNRNKQNLVLYLKLFTLMGVTWVFEIISWAVGGKNYYWLLTDMINLLRGVFIFVIFCCKRSVLDALRKRCGCAQVQPEGTGSSTGTKSTAPSSEGQELSEVQQTLHVSHVTAPRDVGDGAFVRPRWPDASPRAMEGNYFRQSEPN